MVKICFTAQYTTWKPQGKHYERAQVTSLVALMLEEIMVNK